MLMTFFNVKNRSLTSHNSHLHKQFSISVTNIDVAKLSREPTKTQFREKNFFMWVDAKEQGAVMIYIRGNILKIVPSLGLNFFMKCETKMDKTKINSFLYR